MSDFYPRFPGCHLRKTTDQNVDNDLITWVVGNPRSTVEAYDPYSMRTSSTVITIPQDGVYAINCSLDWDPDGTRTYVQMAIEVNGSAVAGDIARSGHGANFRTIHNCLHIHRLVKGDTISVLGIANGSSPQPVRTESSFISVQMLRKV